MFLVTHPWQKPTHCHLATKRAVRRSTSSYQPISISSLSFSSDVSFHIWMKTNIQSAQRWRLDKENLLSAQKYTQRQKKHQIGSERHRLTTTKLISNQLRNTHGDKNNIESDLWYRQFYLHRGFMIFISGKKVYTFFSAYRFHEKSLDQIALLQKNWAWQRVK